MSPHTPGPYFYSYVHLRKPRLAHTVTWDSEGIFFGFLAPVRTNFGRLWAGRSQSELFSQLPQFRVRTFSQAGPTDLPPYFRGSLVARLVRACFFHALGHASW